MDGDRVDTTAPLEKPEDRYLAGGTTTSFAFPDAAEIAFINLDLSRHEIRCIGDKVLGNEFPELVKI